MLYLYIVKNFDSILDLENPEPLANLYTRSYFRGEPLANKQLTVTAANILDSNMGLHCSRRRLLDGHAYQAQMVA